MALIHSYALKIVLELMTTTANLKINLNSRQYLNLMYMNILIDFTEFYFHEIFLLWIPATNLVTAKIEDGKASYQQD